MISLLATGVSGSAILVGLKSIRRAKLYHNRQFPGAELAVSLKTGIGDLRTLFGLNFIGVSLWDIMLTNRPPIDHSRIVWC